MSNSISIHARVRPELKAEIVNASQRLDMYQPDTIRLLITIGLAELKRIKYDLPTAIVHHGRRKRPKPRQ